jgi:transcriptional regulator with GAF, ATPase, and Fis domain
MQVVASSFAPTLPRDRGQLDERLPRRDEPWRGDEIAQVASPGDAASRRSVEEALERALEEVARLKARLADESNRYRDVPNGTDFEDIIGRTAAMAGLDERITQVAGTNSAVLVTGETGTGKELVARAVHRRSHRRDKPLVIVNCGALTPTLVESELFGHERGAFTGAMSRVTGRFELAHRGTIFLDEVG